MEGAADSLDQGRALSTQLFARDIKHIMLLHIGGFQTVMLPQLLQLLKQRGFTVVSLREAEGDPAYSIHPDLSDHWDGTFLEQLMRARHLEGPKISADRLAKLDAVCR